MIYSLAMFLMLVLYRGDFAQRAAHVLFFFTMGSVAVARIAIEQDRQYSLAYGAALGLAAFVVMATYVPNSLFCLLLLLLIGYLSDRIVHDCTLIDDNADSSGQGLIDVGGKFLESVRDSSTQDEANTEGSDADENVAPKRRRREPNQPGRTVMYLALGALPLFGIGQFLMPSSPSTWQWAQWLLVLYLFAALSLLVTTSFLGLRRYLRQRKTDLPPDVSIAWIAGGLGLIGLVLSLAYLAPLPGKGFGIIRATRFFRQARGFVFQ